MQVVFSGKPAYARKKLRELQSRGYMITKEKKWPDGSSTFVMDYVGTNRPVYSKGN